MTRRKAREIYWCFEHKTRAFDCCCLSNPCFNEDTFEPCKDIKLVREVLPRKKRKK